ncbi:MAG: F0F1 ATP synthase subunit A [Alphaproteobacteria bacterium]|nr:MAG: F0F1 ATP synthase subunit A [Alphaproteobacteria bacterium]
MANPLEQFEVVRAVPIEIAGIDASITNASIWMLIVVTSMTLFLVGGMRRRALVPGRWQSMVELSYEFVANMVRENVGTGGRAYFPFVFTLFMFILGANVTGLIPGAFTVTSHLAVTFAFAALIFLGVIVIGFARHGLKFLTLFVAPGTPAAFLALIVPLEVISFCTRPITHSVRLFANMTAGHILLKVFGGFIVSLGAAGGVLAAVGIFPLVFNVALTALELLVAVIQAYVFAILTCVYLNDAVNLSH